jgi:hypothetical protein
MASATEIYNILCDAASQDPTKAQASLQRLQALQKAQGTYADMQLIASTRTVPLDVRRMAIIQFKNSGAAHWRSRV